MALMEEMPMPHNGSIGGPGAGVDGECDPFLWCDTDGGPVVRHRRWPFFWRGQNVVLLGGVVLSSSFRAPSAM